MFVMCLVMALAVFLSSGTSSALAATAGTNANNTALHERWTVGEDGKISAVYPESINWAGDIEARATTGYLTYKLSDNLSGQDEYYTSVTVSNIGDLNRASPVDVQIMPWYVNNQNWVMFSIHAWTGDTANVELVSKWFVNGESNGDNWQDNSCIIFSGSRDEWNAYYSENTFTIWSRIKGDQVLFGIDTQTGDYQNNMQVYEPTAGRFWNESKNKYRGTFRIPGLADAMKAKWESSYAGFDARRCSATFTDFVLTNDVADIALNQAIAYAKFDIERYVSAENYYDQQWKDVQKIVSEAKTAFESVKDIDSLNESVSGYQTQIGNVATKNGVTKNEIDVAAAKDGLTWDAFCPDMEIGNVFRNFTLPSTYGQGVAISWQSSDSAIVIDGTTAKVTPSDNGPQSVTLTATLKKGEASDTETFTITVPQLDSVLVEQAKEDALTELDAIKNDNNFYNNAEWTEIMQIIEQAKNAINAADEIAEVDATLAKAKQDIGFITDKVNAKNEISAYAEAKGEENYWPDDWTEIGKIVTDAQAEIDKAATTASLQEIVDGAKEDIDKVQAAVRTEGKWIINDKEETYTGDDTASTIDDPQMQNIYLVDSKYKTGYKVSVTFTAKETNGRPGTRVGLIPWYVDENSYVSVYLSKSVWDGNAISLQIKAMLGGNEAFVRFDNVYDSTHALIGVDYTLTVLVEDDFVVVWYNDTLYRRADIAGIAAACADKDVKIGMTVCNTKAEFRDLEQTEIGEEAVEGTVGDYTVKGSGDDFWSVSGDGADEVIVGDDSGNIGNDSWMAYYAVKQFNASGTYLVGSDMKLLAFSPLVNGKVGLVPLFADDNNWVAVYLSESSADGQIMMQLLVKLGGEIVCNESKAIYPATETLLNVSRTFSVYVSGDTVVVWLDGSKNYVFGEKVGDLSALSSSEKLYYGVSIIGAKAEFSGLNVLNITSETVLDPNFAIALTRYELDSYKNQDDYYAEEWSVIKGYIADVINAMEDTGADIDALIADVKVKIDQVNTKTQVDAINAAALASKAAAAEAELDAYFSAKNSDEYAVESWTEMRKTIEQAKAALAACTSEEEINTVVASAKEDIDAFMKLPAPAPLPTDDGEAAQGLTTGEIVAIVFTAVFVVAAVCGLILTFTKFRREKRQ